MKPYWNFGTSRKAGWFSFGLAILALDEIYFIVAIATIGEKVTKVRKLTVSEKIANCFKLRKVKITFAQLRQ